MFRITLDNLEESFENICNFIDCDFNYEIYSLSANSIHSRIYYNKLTQDEGYLFQSFLDSSLNAYIKKVYKEELTMEKMHIIEKHVTNFFNCFLYTDDFKPQLLNYYFNIVQLDQN